MLHIDGSLGEGGGQLLRTSLSLSALTGRPFRLTKIRANRTNPGLRPQHLTAVRAVAAICDAELIGAKLNSSTLEFRPRSVPQAGEYQFDVSEAASGGSAGSVTLIFQAIMWPLLFASGSSQIRLLGGTHVPFSPPFHYLAEVTLPALARLGAKIEVALKTWGWYPRGGGAMTAIIEPADRLRSFSFEPVNTETVSGVAAVTNLPAHIPQRMARRSHNLLLSLGFRPAIKALRHRGPGPGAGIVLWLPGGGSTSLGRKGLAAEKVAEICVDQFRDFVESNSAVDKYLADQLLLPLALAHGRSVFTAQLLTDHTLTNAHLLRQWLRVAIDVQGEKGQPGRVTVEGTGYGRNQVYG